MSKRRQLPVALTIAGSDSGGGAGIQADLKTFASLGAHGTSAITCITAQNPKGVLGIQACRPEIVGQQLEAVFAELPPAAAKTGMLYSAEIIRVVSRFLRRRQQYAQSGHCLVPTLVALQHVLDPRWTHISDTERGAKAKAVFNLGLCSAGSVLQPLMARTAYYESNTLSYMDWPVLSCLLRIDGRPGRRTDFHAG
jgi:hypothetical protein